MTSEPKVTAIEIGFDSENKLGEGVRHLSRAFASAGFETPEIDARFLAQGVLKLDAVDFVKSPDRLIGDFAAALTVAASRRLAGEPVSRILGSRDFFGRTFKITPDVLDPRPDTETAINAVLAIAKSKNWQSAPITFADVGTGSGAILVTLLAELLQATGVGTDVSSAALDVARHNAERHGVAARATFAHTSGLKSLSRHFDLVVSNPPYVASGEIDGLARDVRCYDPRLALDGGEDGLEIYREIVRDISGFTRSTVVVLEVGAGQYASVFELFANAFEVRQACPLELLIDLGGHLRCVALEIHP